MIPRMRPDIDVTPPERAVRRRMNPVEFSVAIGLLCLLVLLCGQTAIAWSINQDLATQIDRAERQLITVRAADREARQLEREIEQYRDHADVIYDIVAGIRPWHGIMYEVGKHLPQAAWLISVDVDDNEITMEGYGLSHEDIAMAAYELDRSPLFTDLTLGGSELTIIDGQNAYRFTIVGTCNW